MGDERKRTLSRRQLLGLGGGIITTFGIGSVAAYRRDRSFPDTDADGIPDAVKRSASVHENLTSVFGPSTFDGFEVGRRELVIDTRYVGESSIAPRTKTRLRDRFAANDIHLHWLDYPTAYDRTWFEATYGYQVERILLPYHSFYRHHVETFLKNIAIQLIVLPVASPELQSLYAVSRDDEFNGVSFGNRCLVAPPASPDSEAKLVLHEIGHLVLCHDFSGDNTGVMGPEPAELDFTDGEWDQFRNGLSNVRDTTGADITMRRCIIEETASDLGQRVESHSPQFP